MKKVRLMDKVFELPILAIILALLSSCVDEFEDANPPPLLDAPAVNSLSVNDTLVNGGQTLSLSINVTDAPGGIDSVGASAQDGNGIERGSFTVETPLTGQTSGEIIITYTAIDGYSGEATLSVAVFDRQFDEDGELVRKNSVPRTQEVTILCRQLASRYSVLGEFLVDDFDSPDVTNREIVAAVDCGSDSYEVADITGGLYTTTYEEEYDTDPAEAVLNWDPDTNEITWTDVEDQFGGEIIQDPAQPTSNYDPDTNTITVYWTATSFGERGVTTYTRL